MTLSCRCCFLCLANCSCAGKSTPPSSACIIKLRLWSGSAISTFIGNFIALESLISLYSFFSPLRRRTSWNSSAPANADSYAGQPIPWNISEPYNLGYPSLRLETEKLSHSLESEIISRHGITKLGTLEIFIGSHEIGVIK